MSALPVVAPRPVTTFTTPSGKMSAMSLGELQRRQRRLLRRLDDDGVAAGKSRRELPGRHHQRIVPRRDRADDADRIAADHRGEPGHIFAGHGAMHVAHGAGEEAEAIGDRRHLVLQHADARLAAIQRLERGERFGVACRWRRQASAAGPSARRAWCATRSGTPSRPRSTAASTCAGEASGSSTMVSSVLGLITASASLGAGDEFRANQHLRVEHGCPPLGAWFAGYFDDPPVCSPSRVR